MVETFLRSLVIGYSGAIMPGSLLTYTIDKSIKHGGKAGFIITIGHSLLELALVILILLGFGRYLGTELAKTIIGIVGGIVLGYFGLTMLRDVFLNRINIDFNGGSRKQGNMVLEGAVISASNPYFIFWWAVVGLGLIMSAYNSFGIPGVAAFYFGHILSDISWYTFISVVISKTRHFINLKVYRVVIFVLGTALLGFGLSFLAGSLGQVLHRLPG